MSDRWGIPLPPQGQVNLSQAGVIVDSKRIFVTTNGARGGTMQERTGLVIESSGGSGPATEIRSCEDRLLYEMAAPGFGSTLADSYHSPRQLLGATPEELVAAGIPEDAAQRLLASLEISRRARAPKTLPAVVSPDHAAAYLLEVLADCPQERVAALALDAGHTVLSTKVVFAGGLDRSVVDPKVLFSDLIRQRAAAFVLAHNHPSGNLEPSRHDIAVTERLHSGADLLELTFLDHLIISGDRWLSMRVSDYLPPLDPRATYYVSIAL